MSGKQADGEGMAFDLWLREVIFNYPKEKSLDRGTYREAVIMKAYPRYRSFGKVR
jgi:hypothetical protein